jgi:Na+-transporting NADH:ubiquinone oxidoreductase subunit NqrF
MPSKGKQDMKIVIPASVMGKKKCEVVSNDNETYIKELV